MQVPLRFFPSRLNSQEISHPGAVAQSVSILQLSPPPQSSNPAPGVHC